MGKDLGDIFRLSSGRFFKLRGSIAQISHGFMVFNLLSCGISHDFRDFSRASRGVHGDE